MQILFPGAAVFDLSSVHLLHLKHQCKYQWILTGMTVNDMTA